MKCWSSSAIFAIKNFYSNSANFIEQELPFYFSTLDERVKHPVSVIQYVVYDRDFFPPKSRWLIKYHCVTFCMISVFYPDHTK